MHSSRRTQALGFGHPLSSDPRLYSPFSAPKPIGFRSPLERQDASSNFEDLAGQAAQIMEEEDDQLATTQEIENSSDDTESDENDPEKEFRTHADEIIRFHGIQVAQAWFNLEAMKYKKAKKASTVSKK
jgi:hypothetical protein